jgi:TolB-like protein/Flp pilus assembly protein TadD
MSKAEFMDDAGSAPAKGSLPPRGAPVRFGDFTLDLDGCSLANADGGNIPLTRSEFALLREFIRHPGRVLSREYLLDALAGKRRDPFDRSIDMLVGRLRRKIEADAKPPRVIVTVPGEGYKFAAPIRAEAPNLSPESATPEPLASAPNKHEPPRLSIVVLPFANLCGDPSQEHFVDGVTENLTTDLSRIRRAVVMGRNTAFTYKGKAVDLKQIGRELNVRYVIEGSVQCGKNRMRVNVQLIDAETGNHLWAERFDKPRTDLFDMQDEIVARLASALNDQLVAAEARRAEKAPTPDSMDLYFQGMAWLNKGHAPENVAQAHICFDRALIADPGNVDALIGSARADAVEGINLFVTDPAAALAAAEAKLIKALSSVPDHPRGHMWLGLVDIWTKRAAEGIAKCEHALELDRNLADAYANIGFGKIFIGRAEETEAHISEGLRLSPRDTYAYIWIARVGQAKLYLGRWEQAVAWYRRSIEVNRNFPYIYFVLGAALAQLGRLDEARSAIKAGLALIPTFAVTRFRATWAAMSDDPTYLSQFEPILEGMRKAGVPEQ